MGIKKKQEAPIVKTWIWLKGAKSKAMEQMRSEYWERRTKELCGKWLEVQETGSEGYHLPDGETMVFPQEVAHVAQSVECPKDPPAKVVKIDRSKRPKPKPKPKFTWTPKSFMPHPRPTKSNLEQAIRDAVNQINELGAENAKLKNQIASLKKKGTK